MPREVVSSSIGLTVGIGPGTATITATQGSVSTSTLITVSAAPPPPVVPSLTNVSPTSGVAGTQVILTGSGFGSSGTVWLGSMPGVVVSWSDQQVVANVAPGSASGIAQVVQAGQPSNSVAFTVNGPTILTISPQSGLPGTQVTIDGSGFGISQGGGSIWLGTLQGIVVSWSDTEVIANVAPGSNAGVAQIIQNGALSNRGASQATVFH